MANVVLTLPEHETCRHRWYSLTCEQFEDMLAACGRQCEACGCPSSETKAGKLFIDHDGGVGNWAVRGLLCATCNNTFRYDRPDPEWAKHYLDNPWYSRMLAERGIDPAFPPPTDWTLAGGHFIHPRVTDPDGRVWHRTEDGQWTTGHRFTSPHTWDQLLKRFGGHNLRPCHLYGERVPEEHVPGTIKGPSEEDYLASIRTLSADEILDAIERAYKRNPLSKLLTHHELLKAIAAHAWRVQAAKTAT